jgi:hypothetical protein
MNLNYTWKSLLLSEVRPLHEDITLLKSFDVETNEERRVDIAKTIRTGVFLTKVEGQQNPALLHSIATADGDGKELALGKRKPFALSGLESTAVPLSFKAKKMFGAHDANRFQYKAIMDADSIAALEEIEATPIVEGTTNPVKLSSCMYLPTGMANLLLRSNAVTAAEMVMVLKAFVAGSLPTPIIVLDETGEESKEDENSGDTDAETPAAGGTGNATAIVAQQTGPTDEEIESHGGKIIQWLMNFPKTELKGITLTPEIAEGIVSRSSKDLHRSRIDTRAIQAQGSAPSLAQEPQARTFQDMEWLKEFGEKLVDGLGNHSGTGVKASKMLIRQYKALGSIDGQRPLEQLSDLAMEILGTRDQSESAKMMSNYLAMQNVEANLSAAQARFFRTGPLEWEDLSTPSGISSHLMEVAGVSGTSRSAYSTEFIIRTRTSMNVQNSQSDVDRILKKDIIEGASCSLSMRSLTEVLETACLNDWSWTWRFFGMNSPRSLIVACSAMPIGANIAEGMDGA